MHDALGEVIAMFLHRDRLAWLTLSLWFAVPSVPSASGQSTIGEEEIRDFLINARVVARVPVKKGKTSISRLTLTDGRITHDAAFQSVDIYKEFMRYVDGRTEENFRDSYKFNLAAYEIARLVGLGDMMPVTVERKWKGRKGSLSWWLESSMDELERSKGNFQPPDPEVYNRQMLRILLFSDLVYDSDRNPGNVLISKDWRLWMIDFTRAFRLETDLEDLADLTRCDRQVLDRLRKLREGDVVERTRRYLSLEETAALMARRTKLLAHFDRLIAKHGERAVLYD